MTARDSFGPSLRSERERRGITLEAIAQSTKIRRSMLAAFERNDVSHLGGGIFRRGFLRAYATAIGLPPEPLVTEFGRLFPESGAVPEPESSATEPVPGGMRLTLEPEARWKAVPGRHGLAAIADTALVLLIASAIARFMGANPWIITGAIGLIYYALATACLGRSLASWYLAGGSLSRRGRLQTHPRRAPIPGWLAGVLWRSAAPISPEYLDSSLDPSAQHVPAQSHAARP